MVKRHCPRKGIAQPALRCERVAGRRHRVGAAKEVLGEGTSLGCVARSVWHTQKEHHIHHGKDSASRVGRASCS